MTVTLDKTARALVKHVERETWRVVSVVTDDEIVELFRDHFWWVRARQERVRLVRCTVNQRVGEPVKLDATKTEIATSVDTCPHCHRTYPENT